MFLFLFLFCFCFVLFCFVLFCFVLFCFVLFCFVLFYFVLFCFVVFVFIFILFCFSLYKYIILLSFTGNSNKLCLNVCKNLFHTRGQLILKGGYDARTLTYRMDPKHYYFHRLKNKYCLFLLP